MDLAPVVLLIVIFDRDFQQSSHLYRYSVENHIARHNTRANDHSIKLQTPSRPDHSRNFTTRTIRINNMHIDAFALMVGAGTLLINILQLFMQIYTMGKRAGTSRCHTVNS